MNMNFPRSPRPGMQNRDTKKTPVMSEILDCTTVVPDPIFCTWKLRQKYLYDFTDSLIGPLRSISCASLWQYVLTQKCQTHKKQKESGEHLLSWHFSHIYQTLLNAMAKQRTPDLDIQQFGHKCSFCSWKTGLVPVAAAVIYVAFWEGEWVCYTEVFGDVVTRMFCISFSWSDFQDSCCGCGGNLEIYV